MTSELKLEDSILHLKRDSFVDVVCEQIDISEIILGKGKTKVKVHAVPTKIGDVGR